MSNLIKKFKNGPKVTPRDIHIPYKLLKTGFLLVNLGKWTEYPSFDTFGDEMEDFGELRPEMETSDRDLSLWEYGVGG